MPIPHRHRWFQFSLSSLLIATAAIAVFIAFNLNWIHKRDQARAALVERGGFVITDSEISEIALASEENYNPVAAEGIPWHRRLLGDAAVNFVVVMNDDDLVVAKQFFPEAAILRGVSAPNP